MSQAILPQALATLRTPLERIRPDPTNPKLNDGTQIDTIVTSLLEFGRDQPIRLGSLDSSLRLLARLPR